MDTNPVEEQILPTALTRKNALFAGNGIGTENWALLASQVATCKMSNVNPVDYIVATLRAILDGHPRARIKALMPWRFNQPSSLAARGRVVALAEDEDVAAERVQPEHLLHRQRQAIDPPKEIYRVRRQEHLHRCALVQHHDAVARAARIARVS